MTEEGRSKPATRIETIEAFYAGEISQDEFTRAMGGLAAKKAQFPVSLARSDRALLPAPTEEQSRGYKRLLNRR